MSEALPKQDLLLKLLKLSTSDNDAEALLAVRKANALLASAGWTWDKLLAGKITIIADPFQGSAMPAHQATRPPPVYAATTPPPPPPPRQNYTQQATAAAHAAAQAAGYSYTNSYTAPSPRRVKPKPTADDYTRILDNLFGANP